MNRREFSKKVLAAGIGLAAIGRMNLSAQEGGSWDWQKREAFKTNFAPMLFDHFRASTKKDDAVDKLNFIYDRGFRCFEDNGMAGRPKEVQDAVAKRYHELGMRMGLFVAYSDFGVPLMTAHRFSYSDRKTDKAAVREFLKKTMEHAVEVSKRMGNKFCTVVPSRFDESLEEGIQFTNVVENLKFCADICEPSGLVMVLEPLNPKDHPDLWLKKAAQARAVCKAVNSPSCKILYDVYHQQRTEGDLINNIDSCWDEIGYFQVGDNPGRKEAGTGEINYKKIFAHLRQKGYTGFVGLEHGQSDNSKAGDEKFVQAYREVDA